MSTISWSPVEKRGLKGIYHHVLESAEKQVTHLHIAPIIMSLCFRRFPKEKKAKILQEGNKRVRTDLSSVIIILIPAS